MGVALYIVAERETPGLDVGVNGKPLGRCDELDKLAESAGVRPLMQFFSQDPDEALAEWEEMGDLDPPEGAFPPEAWYTAAEGLVTVRGLLKYLAAHLTAVKEASRVADDLREFEQVFVGLEKADVRWHLAVDY
jgi:hypothetical protein